MCLKQLTNLCFTYCCRSAMRDFQAGGEFLFIVQTGADTLTLNVSPPDPKNIKRKALLALKARQEMEDFDPETSGHFPTGIENEVVF